MNDIAAKLLEIGAITLRPNEPFTWSSGWRSPIYCDNRLTMSYPKIRGMIADGLVSIIQEQYPDVEVIAGTATAGIPHAAWVAERLNKPMIYVRDKAKGHGKQNLIEGKLEPNRKVVIIEDLISTGGSSLKAAQAVRDAGGNVLGVAAIFTYEFSAADEAFSEANIPFRTLSTYSKLIELAFQQNIVASEDLEKLAKWREHPERY